MLNGVFFTPNSEGKTLLHIAAERGLYSDELVFAIYNASRLLDENGAPLKELLRSQDLSHKNALGTAIQSKDVEIAKAYIEMYGLLDPQSLCSLDGEGITPVHRAALDPSFSKLLRTMMEYDHDGNFAAILDKRSRTPIHRLIDHLADATEEGNEVTVQKVLKTVKLLCKDLKCKFADVPNVPSFSEYALRRLQGKKECRELLKLLLPHNADPLNIVEHVAKKGDYGALKTLIKAKALVSGVNDIVRVGSVEEPGSTAASILLENGHYECLKRLVLGGGVLWKRGRMQVF